MGTRWRRAFCTTTPNDPEHKPTLSDKQTSNSTSPSSSPSPRTCAKLNFLSGHGSNACLKAGPNSNSSSSWNPSSPRSPLMLSLFKNSFKCRSSCGICLSSVKTGQGVAIYTAECSHAFHFPCITTHVRKQKTLACPVCNSAWNHVPILTVDGKSLPENEQIHEKHKVPAKPISKPAEEEKKVVGPSPRKLKARTYDDDESLLSPTGRIIPIPEESVAEEEFPGFFVNPGRKFDQKAVEIKISPESALISSNRNYETYAVALTLHAPPAPTNAPLLEPSQRAPIDLVAVLDAGGSMDEAKLQMLKRAMRLITSSLGSADRLSIVAFAAVSKRLLPLRRMTAQGQLAARRVVDRLIGGQGSSVGEAMRKAAKVLEDRREKNPEASIMLLSDGANERARIDSSNQRQGTAHKSSTRFTHIQIPVHESGFGENGGCSREPAEDSFIKCVGGSLSVVVQDLKVQLGFASGSAPAEITAVYSHYPRPTALKLESIRLAHLYAGEEREILLEIRVPFSAVKCCHVLGVSCTFKDPTTGKIICGRDQTLTVPLASHPFRSVDHKFERVRIRFITIRAIAEARRLIEHNELTSAHQLLTSSRAILVRSTSSSAEQFVRSLEAEMMEVQWKMQQVVMIQRSKEGEQDEVMNENKDLLTPTSAWRAAEKLAKIAIMRKSLNRVSDLHGFEDARF